MVEPDEPREFSQEELSQLARELLLLRRPGFVNHETFQTSSGGHEIFQIGLGVLNFSRWFWGVMKSFTLTILTI